MYAIITRRGKQSKNVGNAINYKGYLCEEKQVGVGEYHIEAWTNGFDDAGEDKVYEKHAPRYACKFNSFLLEKDGISTSDFLSQLKEAFGETVVSEIDVRDILDTKFEKYLVKVGENEGGLFVEIKDHEIERKEEAEKQVQAIENGEFCVNFIPGVFGLVCQSWLPKHIWSLIKQYATYHKGDEEDEDWAEEMGHYEYLKENLCGWFYDKKALETLKKNGLRVSYCDIEMKTTSFNDVLRELEGRKQEINRLKGVYQNIRKNMKYVPLEDIASTNIENKREEFFAIPEIGIKGHNIYGSGTLLFVDDSFLYIIDNNGMDGDDWSRNNLGDSGSAGSIAYRTPLTENVQNWLDDAKKIKLV